VSAEYWSRPVASVATLGSRHVCVCRAQPGTCGARAFDRALACDCFHASFLDEPEATISGVASLEWLDDALIVMRSAFDGGPPRSTSVIGRNESSDTYSMLYYDVRGVSRIYAMGFDAGVWTLSRQDPDFHQRFTGRLSEDGSTISAAWELSDDGGSRWQHDFDLSYERDR
jgi:hypothetical protein